MLELVAKIRKALRLSHQKLDDEIESNINVCLADLRRVGILSSLANADTEDAMIQKACELYNKSQFNFNGKAKEYQDAYEGFRDAISLDGDYTSESKE